MHPPPPKKNKPKNPTSRTPGSQQSTPVEQQWLSSTADRHRLPSATVATAHRCSGCCLLPCPPFICQATLFNMKAEPLFEFGTGPKNTVAWAPNSRFIALCGFGNLAGDIQFWDRWKVCRVRARDVPTVSTIVRPRLFVCNCRPASSCVRVAVDIITLFVGGGGLWLPYQ